MKIINALGGLHTVLYVTAGLIASININSILSFLGKLVTPIKSVYKVINAVNAGMVAANISGSGMGKVLSVVFGEITLSATAAQLAVGAVLGIALPIAATNVLWKKQDSAILTPQMPLAI